MIMSYPLKQIEASDIVSFVHSVIFKTASSMARETSGGGSTTNALSTGRIIDAASFTSILMRDLRAKR